ncbi:MAG: type I glutamate--ammonia ligase [Gemmatimonadota bacterium]|nr:type I glutamate--ammonia ligase [Gemmatimonadota bacterium]MDP6802239.1 type I glutamate--ammonia ligase [Gemmatimonadota bacterium]MDP7032160.1 type I glutamate--ammonia ligase [Gemmatimonadota bacterium]
MSHSLDQIRAECESHGVRYVQLQFVDILGMPKCIEIPLREIDKAFANELMFDGSSIDGFARIDESDMALYPDWSSRFYENSPDGTGSVLRVLSDVYTDKQGAEGARPFEGDPRLNLKSFLARMKEERDWELMTGCEAEFFLFDAEALEEGKLVTHDEGGYFDVDPVDRGVLVRREITDQLQELGFDIEALHHEVAAGQHEIDFRFAHALQTADHLMKFKSLIKSVARDYGLQATFMPKPKEGINGNGMHTHLSIWQGGENLFADPSGTHGLSEVALQFMAGIMAHAPAITAFANPLINSYKRLIPGYEAPTVIAYSLANRSPMIRIPKGTGKSKRIEVRSPDPTANPYFLTTALLVAGLDGIDRGLAAPDPVAVNVYLKGEEWRREHGIRELPASLSIAVDALEADECVRSAFAEHSIEHYLKSKRAEISEYQRQVHSWELDAYLRKY